MMIIESRYGEGWICIDLEPEDFAGNNYFDKFNAGDIEHNDFLEADHNFPMGFGLTPNEALLSFKSERARFNKDIENYRCCLMKMHVDCTRKNRSWNILINIRRIGEN